MDPLFEQFRQRFHGVWRRTTPDARARQIVDRAIEQAVGAMNFFVRGIARDQLRENTPTTERIDLLFGQDGRITVMFDGDPGRRYTTRVGRTARVRTPAGDEMRVTQRLHEDGRLEQLYATDMGTRWHVYRSTGDGQLRMEATTQASLLPQPLHFAFDFARDPAAR